jgi:hypothetical protein
VPDWADALVAKAGVLAPYPDPDCMTACGWWYHLLVIRDYNAYRRFREEGRWRRLSEMSADDSIAVGEALLTSEIMDRFEFQDNGRPVNFARLLGLRSSLGRPTG